MKKLLIAVAAVALTAPVGASAAADCCADMSADCCKDMADDCCEDMQHGGAHPGHHAPVDASK